ncbi:muconolactone Delta-isomerase family protein [Streptomyces sp. NBC_01483]|uniref:muconolactone Delta-isomerase family protein n=1 Tax=Streptomyces sp. NBC_01483 TaxID=2903883 RepID=UPI002E36FA8F|nr:muconolactone Delta-isomerase family protein [Streptomyces sp. NBC_01483]
MARGEVLGLVGESGSGEGQTAFSVLGLLPGEAEVTADRLTFDGKELLTLDATGLNALRGYGIDCIPQEPMSNLDPCFRIGSQLVEPLRKHLGLSGGEARAKVLDLLARVGIADPERVFRSYPHQISGAWPSADNDRLNDILWGLPLFPYMDVAVTPLARHAYEGSVAGRCSR